MLKFSGYPYLIRGQPVWGCLTAQTPALRKRFGLPQRFETVAQPETLGRAADRGSPKTKLGLSGEMTLEQACPPEYRRAQCAFKDSMIH